MSHVTTCVRTCAEAYRAGCHWRPSVAVGVSSKRHKQGTAAVSCQHCVPVLPLFCVYGLHANDLRNISRRYFENNCVRFHTLLTSGLQSSDRKSILKSSYLSQKVQTRLKNCLALPWQLHIFQRVFANKKMKGFFYFLLQ